VAIVTPNHLHYPIAKAFLEAGIHVICDKPMTTTVADAMEAGCDRQADRTDLRPYSHLYRLSDDPADAARWCLV